MRTAKQAGDTKAYEAAKAQRDLLLTAGGKDLKDFTAKRVSLRAQRRNVDLGAAGLAEDATRYSIASPTSRRRPSAPSAAS